MSKVFYLPQHAEFYPTCYLSLKNGRSLTRNSFKTPVPKMWEVVIVERRGWFQSFTVNNKLTLPREGALKLPLTICKCLCLFPIHEPLMR